ncbi:MAG TPA: hypothetical protein VE078_06845 [Thermoanaerobaculia bacterium]|nr:hypothetical protein [Thermoanaerobaculia bacterium]
MLPSALEAMSQALVLQEGELYHQRRFGPETVNRGAVLLDCEWDGGVFESGLFVSGLFRTGEFRGGAFLGGIFWEGAWTGGSWERGYDRLGRYHARTEHPPHGEPRYPPPAARAMAAGDLTVIVSTVYADVARIWHACVRRSLPEARIEIFWDSNLPAPSADLFPGAMLLRREPGRRDYHEAYNDALARCGTPYLALIDSDVYWLSKDLWPRVREELESDENLAAVACISRHDRPSHGTFAVVLKADLYRKVLASLPGGFAAGITEIDPAVPWQRWTHHSTGDLACQAVLEAGYDVRFLNLEKDGRELVRFEGVTAPRRIAAYLPAASLPRLMSAGRYHWGGLAGNRILGSLHDRLFPDGPASRFEVPASALAVGSMRHGAREAAKRVGLLNYWRRGARRIEAFVRKTS